MPRRSIFGEVKDTNKRGQCQIYSNIAEREYLRQAKDTKSRKQCKLICFLPRRNILGAAKVRFPFVSPRPAEDVPDAAGGAMRPLHGRLRPKSESFEIVFWQASGLRDRVAKIAEAVTTPARAPGAGVQNSGVFCARSASAGVVTRYFSLCLIFWCFWIKPKAQEKNL